MQLDSLLRVSQNQNQGARRAKLEILERMLLLQEDGAREGSHVPRLGQVPGTGHQVRVLGFTREEFKREPE